MPSSRDYRIPLLICFAHSYTTHMPASPSSYECISETQQLLWENCGVIILYLVLMYIPYSDMIYYLTNNFIKFLIPGYHIVAFLQAVLTISVPAVTLTLSKNSFTPTSISSITNRPQLPQLLFHNIYKKWLFSEG